MTEISTKAKQNLIPQDCIDRLFGKYPNPSKSVLCRRALERLDLLLLLIEALDLNGSQGMIWTAQKLGIDSHLPNQAEVWKRRCHNPLRKATRRGLLNPKDSEALIILICFMSERLYPKLRQLIATSEPTEESEKRWSLLNLRLKDLISERFNPRRSAVQKLLSEEHSIQLIRQLVLTLSFSIGQGGVDRLRVSLLDSTL